MKNIYILFIVVLVVLGACGRRNDPVRPEGATYPRVYPNQ